QPRPRRAVGVLGYGLAPPGGIKRSLQVRGELRYLCVDALTIVDRCPGARVPGCPGAQEHRCTRARVQRCPGAQVAACAAARVLRCTGCGSVIPIVPLLREGHVETTTELSTPDDVALADRMKTGRDQIVGELKKLIIGQEDVVHQVLLTLFVGGNSLIVGVPGLAKTLLIHTMARVLDLNFNRVQFTPDLMPSDITGTDIIQEDPATGRRSMVFAPGPIFANIVLADEINRTPPKTQSALLEAMQEHRVTIQGRTYKLEEPFYVFATQNPIELEGTYPLPEAQLDRFMFEIVLDHLPEEEELAVVRDRKSVV